MAEFDLSKALVGKLRDLARDVTVVVDLIDERFHLIEWQGTLATCSSSLHLARAHARFPHLRFVTANSDAHFAQWQTGVAAFAALVQEVGFAVVLNKVVWAQADTRGATFPAAETEAANAHLHRMYRHFQEVVPCTAIDHPDPCLADPAHTWGRAPFHYDSQTYQTFMKALG